MGGVTNSFAQKFTPKYVRENDKTFLALTNNTSDNGWIEFRQDKDAEAISPDTFFDRFGKNLGFGEGYQMRSMKDKDETDFRQIRHQRFQLYYKNIRVEGVEYSLHSRNKRLESAHGRVVENLALDVTKATSERQALERALADQKLSADAFKEQELPKGELLIARIGEEVINQNFKLCYVFDVRTDKLNTQKEGYSEPQRVYVDAASGQIVRHDPLIHKCFHIPAHTGKILPPVTQPVSQEKLFRFNNAPLVASNFVPRWSRYQQVSNTFETEPSGTQFRLSHQNGALLTRRDVNNNGSWDDSDVLNNSTNWGTNAQNATTAHWLTQRVYQFYQQFAPDQNGYNLQGTYPRILVDRMINQSNGNGLGAYWNTVHQLTFLFAPINAFNTSPDFNKSFVTSDVLGHEYSHAVTQYNANLTYQGESGALNESISDIFGTAFERYLLPNDWNWACGEDSYQARSMSNPTQSFLPFTNGQPQIYQGSNWQSTADPYDDGGVHTNSGVMNKWFHTLCTGNGPNGQATPAINFDDATKIVYRALRYYLQSSSGYYDAVWATSTAAGDLFQRCSPQDRAVRAAWRAVRIEPGNCPVACDFQVANSTTSSVGCNQPLTLSAACSGGNWATCTGISYVFNGPNAPGTYGSSNVTITAPANAGTYQYSVSLIKSDGNCFTATNTSNVNVNCASPPTCDFSSGPRYVGTWNGLTVQIRNISGKNVLVTAIPNSPTDKYYPRGDNFWGGFNLDPGAAGLQGCLNAGTTAWYGMTMPGGLTPPSGYYQGAESDGAVFYAQNGTNPPGPCDFNSGPRHVGTWNGLNVQIRQFPNGKKGLVTAIVGSSNDKYFPRGDNFWDNFTKDSGVESLQSCLNAGTTDWWGMAFPSVITPPPGYQQGTANDGAVFFSTNGLRVGVPEPTVEPVVLSAVRPNPAQDEVTVTFSLKEAGDVPVRLLDLQGRVQQAHTYKGVAGKNERILRIASLATGVYAVEVLFDGQRVVHKLVKE